jgi:hypothetical protein
MDTTICVGGALILLIGIIVGVWVAGVAQRNEWLHYDERQDKFKVGRRK